MKIKFESTSKTMLASNGETLYRIRGTGRSTSQAIGYIHLALTSIGQDISVRDHHGTHAADQHLLGMIERVLSDLRLTGFTISFNKLTVKFSGFQHPALVKKLVKRKP